MHAETLERESLPLLTALGDTIIGLPDGWLSECATLLGRLVGRLQQAHAHSKSRYVQ